MAVTDQDRFATPVCGESTSGGPKRVAVDDTGRMRIVVQGGLPLSDDAVISFGGVASILWETQDANANELLIDLPTGGVVDVPLIVIGQGVTGVDLGLYNGVVDPRIAIFGIGAVTTAPIWEFRKARGTIAAPTAITTGDDLGSINAWACVAAGEWILSAAIEFDSKGTIATTRGPGIMWFKAATDAAPSVLTSVLGIDAVGLIIRGATSPGFLLKAVAGPAMAVRNEADSAYLPIYTNVLVISSSFSFNVATGFFDGGFGDTSTILIRARDATVGTVEVARTQSAADPYVQIGRDDTGVALSAVTDGLVLQMGGLTGNEAAGQGFGMSWKIGNAASEVEERGSIDLVLQTATNASEDASYIFKAMVAGAMATILSFGGYVGVSKMGFFATAPVVLQTGIAAQKIDYATPGLDTEAEIIAAFNTTNTAINVLRTALNNYGLTTAV